MLSDVAITAAGAALTSTTCVPLTRWQVGELELLTTVSVTFFRPASAKVCLTVGPSAVSPSPKSQCQPVIVPPGICEPEPSV